MKKFLVISVMAIAFSSTSAHAIIPVLDVSRIAEIVIKITQVAKETAKQIEQYKSQLDDLELQAKNTLMPPDWLWEQTQQTIDKILELQGDLNYYKEEYGRINAYLEQYKDYEYYQESENFNTENFDELQADFYKEQRINLEAQDSAYDSFMTSSDELSKEIDTVSKSLDKLRGNIKGAEGQQQAIQYTNQYLDLQSQQLTQLQTAMMAQSRVVAEQANYERMQREQQELNDELWLSGEYTKESKSFAVPRF